MSLKVNMFFLGLACLLLTAPGVLGNYDGFSVVDVGPIWEASDVLFIDEIVRQTALDRKVIRINDHVNVGSTVTLVVSADWLSEVTSLLTSINLPWTLFTSNLQTLIDDSVASNEDARSDYFGKTEWERRDPPTAYLTTEEIDAWLLQEANQSPLADRVLMGQSYEGRDMFALRINHDRQELPALWLDGGIHAREWIAHHTAMYIIDEILFGDSADAQYARDNFRWYIAPNINPDGYEYTWTTDRMWRKNRQPYDPCVGVDLNRNWDANFGGEGSVNDTCEDTFAGPFAFSEPESEVVRDMILTNINSMEAYLSFHAYGQMWLTPYGAFESYSEDYEEMNITAHAAIDAIGNVNGSTFYVGTPWELLYLAPGGSFDWAKLPDKANIKYSYSIELRPRSTPEGGFLIGPENIEPSGKELFAGVLEICRRIDANMSKNKQ